MKELPFTRLGPAAEPTVDVPPPATSLPDYSFVHDPTRHALVYVPAPVDQVGHAWVLDDRGFHPGVRADGAASPLGPTTSVYDPTRQAIVAWGFDYAQARGVVLGDRPEVLACTGELPTSDDYSWDNLVGVFGLDPRRGVTVCVTQRGLFELTGTQWTRVSGPPEGLPAKVEGYRTLACSGAGAIWDAPRGELLFWFADRKVRRLRCFAWDGTTWRPVATDGLPEADLCTSYSPRGFALGDHATHGVVLYAGPELGLFARTDAGWRALDVGIDPPPRGDGAQLAHDHARGVLVLGPYVSDEGNQNVVHELKDGRWRRLGRTKARPPFARGTISFARHHGVTHASGHTMNTFAWNPATYWSVVVDDDNARKASNAAHLVAMVTAWDGVLHAVLDDGSVVVLDGDAWTQRADGSSWSKPEAPLVAFDPIRQLIVAWGPRKQDGSHKDETYTFDGTAWSKAKKAKAKPVAADQACALFDLFFDTARGMVARLGQHELAHFDGTAWTSTPLAGGAAIETWRRAICHDPASGITAVVNCAQKTVVRLDGATVAPVGTFAIPTPREQGENLPFDHWWFDDTTLALNVHNDVDQTESFALDLRAAFLR